MLEAMNQMNQHNLSACYNSTENNGTAMPWWNGSVYYEVAPPTQSVNKVIIFPSLFSTVILQIVCPEKFYTESKREIFIVFQMDIKSLNWNNSLKMLFCFSVIKVNDISRWNFRFVRLLFLQFLTNAILTWNEEINRKLDTLLNTQRKPFGKFSWMRSFFAMLSLFVMISYRICVYNNFEIWVVSKNTKNLKNKS